MPDLPRDPIMGQAVMAPLRPGEGMLADWTTDAQAYWRASGRVKTVMLVMLAVFTAAFLWMAQ